jgi:neurofibromin 1
MNIPITIKVSSEYVQVMTVRKQEFLYGVTTVINDVYLITEIEDITLVSNARNQEMINEFHFKYNKGKSHHTFTSMKREAIVNVSNSVTFFYQMICSDVKSRSVFSRRFDTTSVD